MERKALHRDDVLFLIAVTVIGLLARLAMFNYVSQDYQYFLGPWFETLREEGFSALGEPLGDYSPLYYYFLAAAARLTENGLYAVKGISCAADIVLAFYGFRLVQRVSQSLTRACVAYALVFLLPTVAFNSAAWAQCDAMYTAALVACVYYVVRGGKNGDVCAMLAYGVAFSLKLQAILIAPFLLILFVCGRIRLRTIPIVPGVYVLTCIPAWLLGRSFPDLLMTYFDQTQTYGSVAMNAPSLYLLFSPYDHQPVIRAGVCLCAGAAICAAYLAAKYRAPFSPRLTLVTALACAMCAAWLLPGMHERYFYVAEVLAVAWAVVQPRSAPAGVMLCVSSIYTYANYFWSEGRIPTQFFVFAVLAAALWYLRDTWHEWRSAQKTE